MNVISKTDLCDEWCDRLVCVSLFDLMLVIAEFSFIFIYSFLRHTRARISIIWVFLFLHRTLLDGLLVRKYVLFLVFSRVHTVQVLRQILDKFWESCLSLTLSVVTKMCIMESDSLPINLTNINYKGQANITQFAPDFIVTRTDSYCFF